MNTITLKRLAEEKVYGSVQRVRGAVEKCGLQAIYTTEGESLSIQDVVTLCRYRLSAGPNEAASDYIDLYGGLTLGVKNKHEETSELTPINTQKTSQNSLLTRVFVVPDDKLTLMEWLVRSTLRLFRAFGEFLTAKETSLIFLTIAVCYQAPKLAKLIEMVIPNDNTVLSTVFAFISEITALKLTIAGKSRWFLLVWFLLHVWITALVSKMLENTTDLTPVFSNATLLDILRTSTLAILTGFVIYSYSELFLKSK